MKDVGCHLTLVKNYWRLWKCKGRPMLWETVRYVMFAFSFTTAANPFSLPSTWAKPNDNQQAQRRCGYPKDEVASPMTTRRAQHWRGWRGKSNDNTVSTTLMWMMWQVQRQHGEHNVGMDDMCQQARFVSPSPPKQRKQRCLAYPAPKWRQQPCIVNNDANSLGSHDQAPRRCKHPWFM